MRTPHWLTPLAICILTLCSGSQANAQYSGMPPAGIQTQGLPPGAYNPYPQISPFQHGFSHTYNNGGLWFNNSISATGPGTGRSWFMNVDYIKSTVRELNGLVGDRNSQSYYDLVYDDLSAVVDQQFADDFGFFNYFDAVDARVIPDIEQSGVRISTGFWNPDASGFAFDVTWNREQTASYNARRNIERLRYDPEVQRRLARNGGIENNSRVFRPNRSDREILEAILSDPDFVANDDLDPDLFAPLVIEDILESQLFNLNGLPIDNGSFAGFTQPYDMDFIITQSHQSFGTNLGMFMSPLTTGGLTIRPYIGARYLYVQEGFHFLGIDSNTLYDGDADDDDDLTNIVENLKLHSLPNQIDEDGDFIIDNAGFDENNAAATNFNQLNGSFITSFLNSEVKTHLAGPEFALRYDIGSPTGDGFSLYGMTKVGAMINRESIRISGDNIGAITAFDPTDILTVGINGGALHTEIFDVPTDGTPSGNEFTDSRSQTHISPLFEQSFMAELPIFDRVPFLSNIRQLKGARLRFGYSWLWVGDIASPNQSIVWQANPRAGLFPKVNVQRDDYSVGTASFGINWSF